MANEIKAAFAQSLEPEIPPHEMYFAHFIELFCRVASEYHNQILIREGAQLRRAVESCRLEFSLELLLQRMDIKIMRDDNANFDANAVRRQETLTQSLPLASESSGDGAAEPSLEGLTLEIDTRFSDESKSFESVVNDIRIHLETFERANLATTAKRTKRVQSMLFARLPPRKVLPQCDGPTSGGGYSGISDKIPSVTLIRELMSPPPLPAHVLKKLENAIMYQNMGQYHVRDALFGFDRVETNLNVSHVCRWRSGRLRHARHATESPGVCVLCVREASRVAGLAVS